MDHFEELSAHIRKNPDDLEAWKSLLTLVDDPKKKKDCQEQIERILAKQQAPSICPQCGAGMTIYFAGEMQDKRAKCAFCGTEIDIPDSYSKVVIEQHTGFGQFVPDTQATIFERRSDTNGASINTAEIEKLIMEKGLIAARQELGTRGIKGLKIDDFTGVDKSSQVGRILEQDGVKALEKSQGVVVLTPKQANLVIKGILASFFILPLIAILILLIQAFVK